MHVAVHTSNRNKFCVLPHAIEFSSIFSIDDLAVEQILCGSPDFTIQRVIRIA
jgi:hypothetical protein